MLEKEMREVNKCQCNLCTWRWDSLVVTSKCPSCRSREWNGKKKIGKPLKGTEKIKASKRVRRELVEYSEDW